MRISHTVYMSTKDDQLNSPFEVTHISHFRLFRHVVASRNASAWRFSNIEDCENPMCSFGWEMLNNQMRFFGLRLHVYQNADPLPLASKICKFVDKVVNGPT